VQENLWHHDGVKYRLLAWVIMPNHVHALVEIWSVPLGEILKSWKSYTSKEALKILRGGDGPSPSFNSKAHGDKLSPPRTFWEEDYFDRYRRDEDHYRRVVRYIESNPAKTGLVKSPEEWAWSSAHFRGEPGPVVPVLTHPAAKRVPSSNV
jgi:putative transposase